MFQHESDNDCPTCEFCGQEIGIGPPGWCSCTAAQADRRLQNRVSTLDGSNRYRRKSDGRTVQIVEVWAGKVYYRDASTDRLCSSQEHTFRLRFERAPPPPPDEPLGW